MHVWHQYTCRLARPEPGVCRHKISTHALFKVIDEKFTQLSNKKMSRDYFLKNHKI